MFIAKIKTAAAPLLAVTVVGSVGFTAFAAGPAGKAPGVNPTAIQTPARDEPKNAEPKKEPAAKTDPLANLPSIQKLKVAEEAYKKAREEAAKELDMALMVAREAHAKASKAYGETKDKDARAAASETMREAQLTVNQLLHIRTMLDSSSLGSALPPPVPQESRLHARLEQPSLAISAQLKLGKGQGVVLTTIRKGGTLEKAGFRDNDILIQLNGKPVPSELKALRALLVEIMPDTAVPAIVMREGEQESIKELKLPALGAPPPTALKPVNPTGK